MSYADDLATVKSALSEDGQPCTLTFGSGTYDPVAGTFTDGTSTVDTNCVVLPMPRGLMNQPGSTIQNGDQQLFLPGDIDQPAIGTIASIGGKDYTIADVKPLNPGGIMILYDCVIRL